MALVGYGWMAAAFALALAGYAGTAEAACTSTSPPSNTTDDCSGANTVGVVAPASTGVTLNLLNGGSIIPLSGPSIALGTDAEVNLQANTTTGDSTINNNYSVLVGDGSTVVVDGTLNGQGGIAGPLDTSVNYTSWLGISHTHVTVDNTGKILTNGTTFNAAIYGRGGNNVYQIDGEITASGGSASGIALGNNDQVTLGATGKITTVAGNTSDPIDGFGMTGVTVKMLAGSSITLHGIGRAIQVGGGATVTVAGSIFSYGDTAITNSAGGTGIEVGSGSHVWLQQSGQIITGNTTAPAGGLNNGGSGGVGITSWVAGASNSIVQIDGLIDTQKASGIFSGTGDQITIGSTGKITVRGSSNAVSASSFYVSPGNDHWSLDVGGRVEQLGTGKAVFLGTNAGPDLYANVTVEEGASLFAQGNLVYDEYDGAGSYGAVIDNLIVKGTIQRGSAGKAINLSDGADTLTLFPTYSITGGIDGGNTTDTPQIDTFAFDGAANTSGTFDFDSIAVTNFEAGDKKGAGHWTLTGNAGTGINGTFAVESGLLSVNGTMNSADFNVASAGTLGGNGTIKSFTASGKVAPGNSIGTLTAGTATYSANSVYEVEVNASGAGDKVIVTGAASIDPTAKVSVLAATGTYVDNTAYLILDASSGSLTGTFAPTVIDNSAFLAFALDYTHPKQVWLTVSSVANLPDVAETPNQLAAATGIQEQGPGTGLFDAIAMLDADDARAAFDLSSGEIHAAVDGALLDDSRFVREAVLDRLDQSFGEATAGGGGAEAVAPGAAWGVWGRGVGSSAAGDGDGNAASFSRSLGGFFAGVDAAQAGAWRLGGAVGYQGSSLSVPDRASVASVGGYHAAAYGALEAGGFALRVGAAAATETIDTTRNDTFGGFSETLTAHYGATVGQLFSEAAYRAHFGGVEIEPFAGVARVRVSTDGFSESGGIAGLSSDAQSHAVTFTSLGARVGTLIPLGATALKLSASVAWQHIVGDTTPTADLAFAGGTPFTVAGVPMKRDALRLQADADWTIGGHTSLGLGYSGQLASGFHDHAVTARLTIRF